MVTARRPSSLLRWRRMVRSAAGCWPARSSRCPCAANFASSRSPPARWRWPARTAPLAGRPVRGDGEPLAGTSSTTITPPSRSARALLDDLDRHARSSAARSASPPIRTIRFATTSSTTWRTWRRAARVTEAPTTAPVRWAMRSPRRPSSMRTSRPTATCTAPGAVSQSGSSTKGRPSRCRASPTTTTGRSTSRISSRCPRRGRGWRSPDWRALLELLRQHVPGVRGGRLLDHLARPALRMAEGRRAPPPHPAGDLAGRLRDPVRDGVPDLDGRVLVDGPRHRRRRPLPGRLALHGHPAGRGRGRAARLRRRDAPLRGRERSGRGRPDHDRRQRRAHAAGLR